MMPKTIRKKLILVNLCVENAAQKPLELPAQEALLINKHVNKSTAARDKCNKQTKFNCSLNINTWEEAELRLYTVNKLSGGLELDCEKLKRTLKMVIAFKMFANRKKEGKVLHQTMTTYTDEPLLYTHELHHMMSHTMNHKIVLNTRATNKSLEKTYQKIPNTKTKYK